MKNIAWLCLGLMRNLLVRKDPLDSKHANMNQEYPARTNHRIIITVHTIIFITTIIANYGYGYLMLEKFRQPKRQNLFVLLKTNGHFDD